MNQLKKLNLMSKNLSLYSNENDLLTERTLLTNSKVDGFNTSRILKTDRESKNMKRKLVLNNTSMDFIRTPRNEVISPKHIMNMPKINMKKQRNSSIGLKSRTKEIINEGLSMPKVNKK